MWGFSSCHRKRALFAPLFLLLVSIPAFAVTASGFVTKIDSTTAFDMGSLHVLFDSQTQCLMATPSAKQWVPGPFSGRLSYHRPKLSRKFVPCGTLNFVVGERTYIVGTQYGGRSFVAKKIIAYTEVLEKPGEKLRNTAIIEEQPELQNKAGGWNGILWVDGYPLTITTHTRMLTAPASTSLYYMYSNRISYNYITHSKIHPKDIPAFSSDLLRENNCVTYHAIYGQDGSLTAENLRFWPNHVDAKEKRYWNKFRTWIIDPDYKKHIYGSIRFNRFNRGILRHGPTLTILPDRTIQEWVSNLGMGIVPRYQRGLPDTDATKIHFRFYVVKSFGSALNGYLRIIDGVALRKYDDVLVAMPNGIVLIPDSALEKLNNKAELAAILEYAISSILQKQAYVIYPFAFSYWPGSGSNVGDQEPGVWQSEQQLRIGIRQMYLAGYDIREAPFAWAVAQDKPVNNPIINSKHPNKDIPWYAAYAFNYISQYYKDVDYSKLKRGEKEYQAFLKELYKADPSLPHPKVAAAATSAAATK
jgi:hypothetical protein